jgi:hypothetical protein
MVTWTRLGREDVSDVSWREVARRIEAIDGSEDGGG